MAHRPNVDEIPNDSEVLKAVGDEPEGKSPSEVLGILVKRGHTRANVQRAIQRVLDRGKIQYNTALQLTVVEKQDQKQAA